MRCRSLCLCMAVVLGSLLLSRGARAQETTDARARQHFEAGEDYYAEGDYEGAVRELLRAYELSHRPELFFNLYLAEERLGRLDAATEHLEAYLQAVPDAPERELLERRLANLRARIEAARSTTPPVEAEHAVPPVVAAPDAPPPRSPRGPDGGLLAAGATALVIGGLGLVGLAVGGGLATGENDRLARSCGSMSTGTCSDAEVADLRTFSTVADVGLGVGVAGVAAGTVLVAIAMTASSPGDAAATRVTPRLSASEVGLALTGTF